MTDPNDTKYFTFFERVTSVTPTEQGLLAEVEGELLRVEVLREDVLRLKISRGRQFDESPTFAVRADFEPMPTKFTVEQDEAVARLRTSQMVLTLGKAPFYLTAHRADGSVIFETYADEDGRYHTYATLNDQFAIRRRCQRDDAFYGLGEKSGHFNRRGRDFTLWNTDVLNPTATAEFTAGRTPNDLREDRTSTEFDPYYVSIPFFYHLAHSSSQTAAFFIDNGYRGTFDFAQADHYGFQFGGGQYTEYIFGAPTMPDILAAYTWLTGRMSLPPLWALGHHQCRWLRYSQADVEALAARHRDQDIPCDALWLDIEYMDGYRVFTWNEDLFPDAPAMLHRLSEQGFKTITIIDPGVKVEPGYWVFDQAVARDVLCKTEGDDIYIGQVWPGKTAFPDFVSPEGRQWWGELNAAHVASGLAGIWNDMNEPATGEIPPEAMRFGDGQFSHERYHNQYALLMAMSTTEGLLQAMPDKRTFILSRAGFAGIQRYSANWLGDNQSRWDHLWLSMPMAMGFGLSGQPFLGADIGGFAGNTHAELFLRWLQYGVLTPFCRNHNEMGNVDQYAWTFGTVVEELVRQAIQLRYRLLPYIYAAFKQAAATGEPIQKPLLFHYQDDVAVRDMDDQYLFGRDLLVAPVFQPGTTARQVYLPEGTWYHWHTGEQMMGARFVVAETPMAHIPLYVRGGAIIPMWPEAPASTAGYHPQAIELHLFVPTTDGVYESELYEDDGLSFGFREGAAYTTTFRLHREGERLTLTAVTTGNGYAEFAREAFHLVMHGAAPKTVTLDGEEVGVVDGRFHLPNAGTNLNLEMELDA